MPITRSVRLSDAGIVKERLPGKYGTGSGRVKAGGSAVDGRGVEAAATVAVDVVAAAAAAGGGDGVSAAGAVGSTA